MRQTVGVVSSAAFLAAALCAFPGEAPAQSFPSRAISISVPTPPGGPMDTMMRAVAGKASENLGQPVVIENRTGAGGIISNQTVLNAPADGYSVAAIYLSHATNVHMVPNLPYDTLKAFTPLVMVAKGPLVLMISSNVPAKNVGELIAYAKANPDKLNLGASAIGGASHLGGELFKLMTGLKMATVPYKGTASLLPDMLTGRVHVTIDSYLQYAPHAKTGQIRMLAVSSANRFELDPTIPAIGETVKGYEALAWWGLAVAAGTPPQITERLHKEFARALEDEGVKQRIRALGIVPGGGGAAEFQAFIRSEIAKWENVVKTAGLVQK